jgi:hypothetical protein
MALHLLNFSYSGQNPCIRISRSDTICTKREAQASSLSFFYNFGKIIPPEMEVHTCELGEFLLTCVHENIIVDKTHVPDFPLEAFQNFELFLVPD